MAGNFRFLICYCIAAQMIAPPSSIVTRPQSRKTVSDLLTHQVANALERSRPRTGTSIPPKIKRNPRTLTNKGKCVSGAEYRKINPIRIRNIEAEMILLLVRVVKNHLNLSGVRKTSNPIPKKKKPIKATMISTEFSFPRQIYPKRSSIQD